jgi:hypothetical protein
MNVGTFKFGSLVMGTDMPWSDDDHGYVTLEGMWELYNFDMSKPTGRKSWQRKNERNEDVLLVPLLNLFRQANKPSVNFHSVLATLESDYIDVPKLRNVVDSLFDQRSYYFSTVSFCNNCPMTLKGALHRAYASELALMQYQLNMFTVRPTFWKVDGKRSAMPNLLQLLKEEGKEEGNKETSLASVCWAQQSGKVVELETLADEMQPVSNNHERYEQLAQLLLDVQNKVRENLL